MNNQNRAITQISGPPPPTEKQDPETIRVYIDDHVGISRMALNAKAFIGIFIFGWLMKMNYDDLGEKGLGWAFLIAMAFVFAIGRQVEPMFFIFALVIYVAAWIHTNVLLTKKQSIAREQYFKGNS